MLQNLGNMMDKVPTKIENREITEVQLIEHYMHCEFVIHLFIYLRHVILGTIPFRFVMLGTSHAIVLLFVLRFLCVSS
jgi:hypothetical protein